MRQVLSRTARWSSGRTVLAFRTVPQFECRFTGILSKATLTAHFIAVAFLLPPLVGACITKKTWPVSFPQEELRKRLTSMQYHVTQERGTESAFTGEFTHQKDEGTYTCVVCGSPLFNSNTKFDSGSGWPSFFDHVKEESITWSDDFSYGMHRVETACSQCGAHLGHLFDDGPRPTGKRYCINSASLAFQPRQMASSSSSMAEGGGASSSVRDEKTQL